MKLSREIRLQILGSLFIAVFLVTFDNKPLPILLRTAPYYRDVAITFAAAWLLFGYVGFVTRQLDRRLGWHSAPVRRLAAQSLYGVAAASLLAYFITYLQYRWIDPENIFAGDSFLVTEFPIIVLFNGFANGLYAVILYFLGKTGEPASASGPAESGPAYLTGLLAANGNRRIQIPAERVALICLEHGLTWVVTFDNLRYHLDEPLQCYMQRLDPDRFFRINRQAIVQLSACGSWETVEFGKIRLRLVAPVTTELLISQKTAPAFRKWMQR
ncbi:LytTR family DNA-binding domain-containing protein [Larkinella soli]|uniref:LytTR family DNA-binding domain-containing protein n=1 Tax=Larkinella soli TaxID=1770527 RepID=UPI000FFC3492|nr:LytTR family DNA-binding domain-containing protein [Larkinella soli]